MSGIRTALAVPEADVLARATSEVTAWNGMDAGIIRVVAGLRARGLPTAMSCEGHSDGGTFWPWVMLDAGGPPQELYALCYELIWDGFYAGGRRFPPDEIAVHPFQMTPRGPIVFIQPGCFGPGGVGHRELASATSAVEQRRLLVRCRSEFDAFAEYLAAGRV